MISEQTNESVFTSASGFPYCLHKSPKLFFVRRPLTHLQTPSLSPLHSYPFVSTDVSALWALVSSYKVAEEMKRYFYIFVHKRLTMSAMLTNILRTKAMFNPPMVKPFWLTCLARRCHPLFFNPTSLGRFNAFSNSVIILNLVWLQSFLRKKLN